MITIKALNSLGLGYLMDQLHRRGKPKALGPLYLAHGTALSPQMMPLIGPASRYKFFARLECVLEFLMI